MNMPGIDRSILPTHFATIEANNPIKSSGFCRAAASGMYSPITDWTFSLRNVRGSIFSVGQCGERIYPICSAGPWVSLSLVDGRIAKPKSFRVLFRRYE
jgi:hypothetical protein